MIINFKKKIQIAQNSFLVYFRAYVFKSHVISTFLLPSHSLSLFNWAKPEIAMLFFEFVGY